jgi:hypothetical protein
LDTTGGGEVDPRIGELDERDFVGGADKTLFRDALALAHGYWEKASYPHAEIDFILKFCRSSYHTRRFAWPIARDSSRGQFLESGRVARRNCAHYTLTD